MFDIIPWLDETYLVEMGRLFLCGGDSDSILLSKSGVVMMPLNYICPLVQECAFRLFGVLGVRLSPFVGWLVGWLCFWKWLRDATGRTRIASAISLLFLTSPLVFQSAILARPDTWALMFSFAALAVLGRTNAARSTWRIACGAFLAVASVFAWPSSVITALVYPAFCFTVERKREFFRFCLFSLISAALLAIPLLPCLDVAIAAFNQHAQDTAPRAASLANVVVALAKEFARSPFLFSIGLVGVIVWIRQRHFMAILALGVGLAVGIRASLYVFRIVYFIPLWMLACADALTAIEKARPKLSYILIWTAIAYGVISGPIGYSIIGHTRLPLGLRENLARTVGTGPKVVFAPDFATYYIGRELGWHQLGFADPSDASNANMVKAACGRAEAAVIREWDPYETTQQSCTPYGLFCKYVLKKAQEEKNVPEESKSWAAKFGSQFTGGWHAPIVFDGFTEIGKFGMIRVFLKDKSMAPTYE